MLQPTPEISDDTQRKTEKFDVSEYFKRNYLKLLILSTMFPSPIQLPVWEFWHT